ncbi:MAG: hypothetical protein ACOC2C_07745 [Cyclonatronaceae bacterium]
MLYTPFSILVGLLIAVDALLLLRSGGEPTKLDTATSTTEIMWLIISLVHLFSSELYGLALITPIIFVSYVAAGFVASFFMVKQMEHPEEIEGLKIPKSFTFAALGFGLFFSKLNVLLLVF